LANLQFSEFELFANRVKISMQELEE